MEQNVKDKDVLLVKDKNSNELYAATKNKKGEMIGVKPDNADNPDLIKFDRHGNMLENFFQNFKLQVKDPTQFEFFKVPAEKFMEAFQNLQKAFQNPDTQENKKTIDMHRVNPDEQKQSQEQSNEKNYAINPLKVLWDKFKNYGVTRETIEKTDNLDKLLNYEKTGLLTLTIKIEGAPTVYTDGRFSLRKQDDGNFMPAAHLIRHKPELERPYFGVKFTEEDKQNLLKDGNLGRVVEAEFQKGVKTLVVLSIDRLTNEIVPFRADQIRVNDNIKGVQLTDWQKADLSVGKAVFLENMTSKQGKPFSANVQFNADKRGFEFLFDNDRKQSQQQNNAQKDVQKTFRSKELSNDQRDSLREGASVYVDGLKDKQGKPYIGYINIDKETGKTNFMFPHEYKKALAEGKVIPDSRHKTQVEVNSNGKTNEATKNVKELLKQGQTQPTEKQEVKKSNKLKMS